VDRTRLVRGYTDSDLDLGLFGAIIGDAPAGYVIVLAIGPEAVHAFRIAHR